MNLTSPSQVKAWCIENDFHPNKVLGQNFLIDQNALKAIVDAGLDPRLASHVPCRVLEIGPGMGVLTEEMLRRGCEVVAIEKDPVLAARLERESKSKSEAEPWWGNLELITADALDWIAGRGVGQETRDARHGAGQETKDESLRCLTNNQQPATNNQQPTTFSCMISNLPYQAGTRILLDLVLTRKLPSMTVLVQTEVAERLAAKEGSKVRGLAGVWAQLDYDVKIVRRVAASCFWPRPAIGSTVVKLTRHDRNVGLSAEERAVFHRLTKQAFEHRRKQLGSIFKDLIQSTARAEELSNQDWIDLARALKGAI